MNSDNENILNNLRIFLENKDQEIIDLKIIISELEQKTENNNSEVQTELKDDLILTPRNLKCYCNCHKLPKKDVSSQTSEEDFVLGDGENVAKGALFDVENNSEKSITSETLISNSTLGSDYIYDENSKMYYSPSTGYYFDQEKNLLYNPYSRTYYSYNTTKNAYEFYCQLDAEVKQDDITEQVSQKKKKKDKLIKKKELAKLRKELTNDDVDRESSSSLEDGEIKSSSEEEEEYNYDESSIQSPFIPNEEALLPCIRAIVKHSHSQKIGSLFLIPYTGGTIGSGTTSNICVPDISISRTHADISFDKEKWTYNIIDLGSTNGTYINGIKITQTSSKITHPLKHGDVLGLGSCKLLIHVHSGNVTCQECEPGVVQAELTTSQDKPLVNCKEEKQKKRKKNLKLIKKKFGLEDSNYVNGEAAFSNKTQSYEDRAEHRRKTIGSQNPYEKDAPPATLDSVVPSSNKGYKMLKQMGWKEGESIGKNDDGILDPIDIQFRNTRAGLGSDTIQQIAFPEDPRLWKWKKAQKRAHELYEGIDDENVDY